MQLPDPDYLPEWAKYAIATLLGAGGVRWFSVWLENRRLAKKDFRETLLERIRELEKVIARMQIRFGNLRVEIAHLQVENKILRKQLGLDDEEESLDADSDESAGDDGGLSS